MKKMNIVAMIVVIVVIGANIIGIYLYQSKQNSIVAYLKQHGQELRAEIIELRQYFPPQGIGRYGRVFYKYTTPSGKTYKSQRWLNQDQYKWLDGKNEAIILYDPEKPNNSILKIEAEGPYNKTETEGVPNSKAECERLMRELVPFAEKMLIQYGEFHPFGGVMKKGGDFALVSIYEGNEWPPAKELIERYHQQFQQSAIKNEIVASGIVYDAKVVPPGTSDSKVDAIIIELDHEADYSVVVSLPYKLDQNKKIIYEQMFASKGEHKIFPVRE